MTKITPTAEKFMRLFPYFSDKNITQEQIDDVQPRVCGYISNESSEINLTLELQTQGVYLATAHLMYMMLNPDKTGGRLTSATEGSVSGSFQSAPVNTIRDWSLSRTEYGLELLQILQQVQPPVPEKSNFSSYYGTI